MLMRSSASKLISLFLFSLLLAAMTEISYAEYYVVYSAPAVVCGTCHRVHHYRVHHYRHYYHRPLAYHRYHGCGPSRPVYVWDTVPACARGCCGGAYSGWEPRNQIYYAMPGVNYSYAQRDEEMAYDPDLATGDDNQVVDPDLDIDK